GLGLEDAQRPAAVAGQVGQLGGAEDEDDDREDDQQLRCAETADEREHHAFLWSWLRKSVFILRRSGRIRMPRAPDRPPGPPPGAAGPAGGPADRARSGAPAGPASARP